MGKGVFKIFKNPIQVTKLTTVNCTETKVWVRSYSTKQFNKLQYYFGDFVTK
jgi:hypothetical protein